jgi:hypothetical protein
MASQPPNGLNRAKSHFDIVEHVLEGVHTQFVSSHSRGTDASGHDSLGSLVISSVEVQVLEPRPRSSDD